MDTKDIRSWALRVIKRIIIEFSFPGILATSLSIYNNNFESWPLMFVSISWVSSQVFRIIKQQKVEGDLGTIERKLKMLTEDLEKKTEELMKVATGGDSWLFLSCIRFEGLNKYLLQITKVGNYPLYDVTVEVWLDEGNSTHILVERVNIGNVGASLTAYLFSTHINLPTDKDNVEYLIKFHSRNGEVNQYFKFARNDKDWSVATRIYKFNTAKDGSFTKSVLMTNIENDFPNPEAIVWKDKMYNSLWLDSFLNNKNVNVNYLILSKFGIKKLDNLTLQSTVSQRPAPQAFAI